jgi:hypothetical protein
MGKRIVNPSPMLARLYAERDQVCDFVDKTVNEAATAERHLSTTELDTLERSRGEIAKLDAQIDPLEQYENARAAGDHAGQYLVPAGQPADRGHQGGDGRTGLGAQVENRPTDYRTAGHVVVDLLRAAPKTRGGLEDTAAQERLNSSGISVPGTENRAVANQTTSDVLGILPTPIVGQIVTNIDAARPFITSIGAKDLGNIPGKTFSRPVITQHVEVAEQTTEKTELASQKMIIEDVDFTKKTFGGVVDVARQTIDWTSPAAWDALITDLQAIYGKRTENYAADAFAASITSTAIEVGGTGAASTFQQWATALYAAAAQAYAGVEELPDHMWMSLDMWASLGPIVDQWTRQTAAQRAAGASSPTSFAGNVLDFDRTVVPSFPTGTLIVGVKSKVEFYEQRIGLLTAVEPRLLGVEVAYGGYAATGTLDEAGFAKVVNAA